MKTFFSAFVIPFSLGTSLFPSGVMTLSIFGITIANESIRRLISANNTSSMIWQVHTVYPPTDEPTPYDLAITILLICCLTCGICGHASQFALQLYANRLRIVQGDATANCAQLYIATLHIVHFLVSASLPSVIIDRLVKIWMFGDVTCKSFFALEAIGQTLSSWIIAMLFVEQFLIAAQWKQAIGRAKIVFHSSCAVLLLLVFIVLLTTMHHVELREMILNEEASFIADNLTRLLRIRTYKCTSNIEPPLSLYINAFICCIDFVIPFIFIIFLTRKIAAPIAKHSDTMQQYNRRILYTQIVLAGINFLAYIPHWISAFGSSLYTIYFGTALSPKWSSSLEDAALIAPHLATSITWLPLTRLSSFIATFDRHNAKREEQTRRLTHSHRHISNGRYTNGGGGQSPTCVQR